MTAPTLQQAWLCACWALWWPCAALAEETGTAAPAPALDPPVLMRADPLPGPLPAQAPPSALAIEEAFRSIERSLHLGQHAEAQEAALSLERLTGRNWRTRYLLGVAQSGLERWEDAVATLLEARQLHPQHVGVALYLGVALQELGQHQQALQVLEQALAQHPEQPALWLNRAHSQQAMAQAAQATHSYQRFLDLSQEHPALRSQRDWVLQHLGRQP